MADLSLTRKISILAYLKNNPVRLRDLAEHFTTQPSKMRDELMGLFTTEISVGGYYETPVDVVIPEDLDDPVTLIDNQTDVTSALTLAEIISLLALIDEMSRSVDAQTRRQLMDLRQRIAKATEEAGFAHALWPAPTVNLDRGIADELARAIKDRRLVSIVYLKMGSNLRLKSHVAVVAPISVTTGANPLLIAAKGTVLRTYRLDRFVSAQMLEQKYTRDLEKDILNQYKSQGNFAGETVQIILEPRARWVAETLPVDKLTEINGLLIIELTVSSLSWLRTLLIRIGDAVIAVKPDRIQQAVANDARAYLEEQER
ncbi:proteasome accessory factor C [Trueperella bonasi]|uniref:Proteasome accessory factor C n=1 Tax=Trueperella bonasi TaxID=312286 RepID=A0ABT9NDJ4_9ACTO|nr:WYL domain-containing protein [Trueperella bonasi]MDP9805460.1 proteasome accessory factor C [Trueperella bonasi]